MVRWDIRYLRQIDWFVLFALCGPIAMGLLTIASAAHTMPGGEKGFLLRQGIGVGLGLLAAAFAAGYDYRDLAKWTREFYVMTVGMLLAVAVAGHTSLGAQRWIKLGPIQFQPSEPAKVLLIIALACFLAERDSLSRWVDLIPPGLYVGVPFLLILAQPDLGTALVLIFILFAMLYMAGAPGLRLSLILLAGFGAVSLWVYAHLHWHVWIPLKDYQITRLIVFLDPNLDPTNSGYHVIQSRIAIGSGGMHGKGWYHGTQNQLGFLPEPHTDFIFAVLSEEFGFVGGATVIAFLGFMMWRLLQGCREVQDRMGRLLITGVACMLAFQVMENVGMTLGMMPVAGIPLPFVSYGPSAMVTNLWAVGLAVGVAMRRKSIMF